MARKEFSIKTKKAAFARCCVDGVPRCEGFIAPEGLLHRCSADLRSRPFHYDHDDADFYSKDNSLKNCVVLCVPCHLEKTKTIDTPKITKTRRIDKTRMKVKARGRSSFRTNKDAPYKATIGGGLIERATGRVIREARR